MPDRMKSLIRVLAFSLLLSLPHLVFAAAPATPKSSWLRACWNQLRGVREYRLNRQGVAQAADEIRGLTRGLETRRDQSPLEAATMDEVLGLFIPCFEEGSWSRGSGPAYDLAGKLIPLKPFRSVFRFIDWEEHYHGRPAGWRKAPDTANFLWGRVRNVRSSDIFAIGIMQIPQSNRFLFDLVLGPFDPDLTPLPSFSWAQGPDSDIRYVEVQGRAYLVARRLELRFGNLAGLDEMIRRVQDLFLERR